MTMAEQDVIVRHGAVYRNFDYWGYPLITFDGANPYDSHLVTIELFDYERFLRDEIGRG